MKMKGNIPFVHTPSENYFCLSIFENNSENFWNEIEEWIIENCNSRIEIMPEISHSYISHETGKRYFYFESENDYITAKLRFE